ncbi:MAG: tRNA (adenosine(37)-N6)-threonylcarbamoyltransferase complex transferase subunit TsaD [Anaerolineales bacterium]
MPAQQPLRILGIETSCDETAAAVVENGRIILSNIVASQVDIHAQYGGVFPEVASRQHILAIYPVVEQALKQAHLDIQDIDAIAVTRGPGLAGSLVIGLNVAKGMAIASGKPLIGINHLEAHLYSVGLVARSTEMAINPLYPMVGLIVSGGHTELVLMKDVLQYQSLGMTLDDAAGEAFDKVARLLKLSYPGGPSIQEVAKKGNPDAFHFPRAWLEGSWNFSFSGLKTAVLREVRKLERFQNSLPVADLAASFQRAVVEVLVEKTIRAAHEFKAKSILVAGGVSANQSLRETFTARANIPLYIPPMELCTDNAAMVAAVGYYRYLAGKRDDLNVDVNPNWPLTEIV